MREALIGVDIGTQGVKTALFTADGRRLARAFRASHLHRPASGAVEEDPDDQFDSVCRTIRTCLQASRLDPRRVAAIGIDGQMAGVIGVGRDGQHVTPYDSWLDTRCAPYITCMQTEAGAAIVRKTGGPPSFNHGPKMLWWMHERPAAFRRIAAFVQPGGYAGMRLCGLDAEQAFIDTTYLHFSGFADNPAGRWDKGLCDRFGFDAARLPRIVEPSHVVGHLTAAMARRCGLKSGVPVIAGCGDTAASFLACGATREGMCVDVAGSASVFAATTRTFCADVRRRTLGWGRSAVPGLWHPYAYINGGGLNLEWFRRELGGGRDLAYWDRRAAAVVADDDSPLFIPHLAGRVSPGWPHLRGAWAGLTWAHKGEHLYRAMLESVALEYGLYREALLALNPGLRLRDVRITGGGEKSAVWNALKADVLGCRVVQIADSEGAPRGVALLAGFGVGLIGSLDTAAAQWVRTGRVTEPDRAHRKYYARRQRRYAALLDAARIWSQP
jgi:xylulokinase